MAWQIITAKKEDPRSAFISRFTKLHRSRFFFQEQWSFAKQTRTSSFQYHASQKNNIALFVSTFVSLPYLVCYLCLEVSGIVADTNFESLRWYHQLTSLTRQDPLLVSWEKSLTSRYCLDVVMGHM